MLVLNMIGLRSDFLNVLEYYFRMEMMIMRVQKELCRALESEENPKYKFKVTIVDKHRRGGVKGFSPPCPPKSTIVLLGKMKSFNWKDTARIGVYGNTVE
jgi:hypothetical protein